MAFIIGFMRLNLCGYCQKALSISDFSNSHDARVWNEAGWEGGSCIPYTEYVNSVLMFLLVL